MATIWLGRLGPRPWLALLVFLAAGCRGDPGTASASVVEFWTLGREGEVVQRMLPEFERRNPGVRVRLQQIPWSAAHEKLLTAYVGEAMPDLFQVGNTWIPEFAALKAIAPLDEQIAASSTVSIDDYFPGIVDTNVIDGATYGLPWYADTRLIFFRPDILEAAGVSSPPRTWSSWVEASTRIQKRAGSSDFAILLPLNEWQPPVIFALQLGAELLRDGDSYGNFRSPRFREAFTFYVELFRRGLAARTAQAEIANLYQDFARGAFTFYISGPWNLGEFRRRLPAAMADKWATAPMPSPDDRYPGLSIAGGASLALFRGSQRKDAAWKLVEYLSEPEQQIELYRLSGDLPARQTAWRDGSLAEDPRVQAFWAQLQRLRSMPKIPEWERVAAKIARTSEVAIRGQITVDEALAALDEDVDALLEKRRWMMHAPEPRT